MLTWLSRWLGVGSPVSPRAVVEQANDPDPENRSRAVEVLATVPEPWAREQLLNLLKDAIGTVRDAARDALRKQGTAAIDVLLKALDQADPKVAVYAAERIGELKAAEGIRPLLLAMKYGAVEVRAAATRALIHYGNAALDALEAARTDPDPWARLRIDEILATIRASAPAPPAEPAPAPDAAAPADLEKGG